MARWGLLDKCCTAEAWLPDYIGTAILDYLIIRSFRMLLWLVGVLCYHQFSISTHKICSSAAIQAFSPGSAVAWEPWCMSHHPYGFQGLLQRWNELRGGVSFVSGAWKALQSRSFAINSNLYGATPSELRMAWPPASKPHWHIIVPCCTTEVSLGILG